jgi:hypothetical protein
LSVDTECFYVPLGLEDEARAFVDVLRETSGVGATGASFFTPQARGFASDVVLPAVLVVSSTTLTTVTKSWVDTYLWPELKRRVDKPSRRFVTWLLDNVLPRGGA